MENSVKWQQGIAGWVACDYTHGDHITDVLHSGVYKTCEDAYDLSNAWNDVHGHSKSYEGVRYVDARGYLYVDVPEHAPLDLSLPGCDGTNGETWWECSECGDYAWIEDGGCKPTCSCYDW